MPESTRLITTLKRALKERGITYAHVAAHLALSEASIKRLFSGGGMSLSLERLEAICGLLDLSWEDLVLRMAHERRRVDSLNSKQEQELVENIPLLLVALLVREGLSTPEIQARMDLPDLEVVRLLIRLDRLKLIELLPDNRVRPLISRDFRWLPGGPIERFFRGKVLAKFLTGDFTAPGSRQHYLHGYLTGSSQQRLQKRIDALVEEFSQCHEEDATRPLAERSHYGLALAFRTWEFSGLGQLDQPEIKGTHLFSRHQQSGPRSHGK